MSVAEKAEKGNANRAEEGKGEKEERRRKNFNAEVRRRI